MSSERALNRVSSLSINRNRNKSIRYKTANAGSSAFDKSTDSVASFALDEEPIEDSSQLSKLAFPQIGLQELGLRGISFDQGTISTPGNTSCYLNLEKYPITVHLIDGTSFQFQVHERTTSLDLTGQLADQLGLKIFEDFRLILVEGHQRDRVLDDDEFIVEATYIREEFQSKHKRSFLARLKNRISRALKDRPNKLVLKKYFLLVKGRRRGEKC